MDLSPAQRVLAFLGAVVVLGGLGAYLLISGGPGHRAAATPSASASGAAAPTTAASGPAATSSPPAGPATPAASAPDIYQWLPFSQADLAKAASVAEAFGAAYDTYSYRESATSYAASMRGLATSELSATLARAYSTPGVASQRAQQQQVSTGRTVINSLRTFGSSSLTFVATIYQTLHTKQGKGQQSAQWAITVLNNGGTWLVNDIEPASAGNS
jgi:hypothetical protein